jgi:hypothetical protein
MDSIACRNQESLQKFAAYKNDAEALHAYAILALASGECVTFNKGEKVYKVERSIWSGTVKLRRKGDLSEYWTIAMAIDPPE